MKTKDFLAIMHEFQGDFVRRKSNTGNVEDTVACVSHDIRQAVANALAQDCTFTMERMAKFFQAATHAQIVSYFYSVNACCCNIIGMIIAGKQLDETNCGTAKRHFDSAAAQFRNVVGVY